MRIFLIEKLKDDMEWDNCDAYVIAAKTEPQVIDIAKEDDCEEDKTVWDRAKITNLGTYLGENKEPFIILAAWANA